MQTIARLQILLIAFECWFITFLPTLWQFGMTNNIPGCQITLGHFCGSSFSQIQAYLKKKKKKNQKAEQTIQHKQQLIISNCQRLLFDLVSTNWFEFWHGASGNFKNQVEPPSSLWECPTFGQEQTALLSFFFNCCFFPPFDISL